MINNFADFCLWVYVIVDDIWQEIAPLFDRPGPKPVCSDSELISMSLIGECRGWNLETDMLSQWREHRDLFPNIPTQSRFNRRQHKIAELFMVIFEALGLFWKELNEESVYVIDSFPISACDNYRIPRCQLYQTEEYRGYQSSKKRFYYGVKIHLMVTLHGQPVEFFLTPASWSDTRALKMYNFDLSENSLVTGDKAYNDYAFEDLLQAAQIQLQPLRKKNSHRQYPAWINYMLACYRKVVETTGSLIEQLLPKHIHAVTARGFELKLAIFVLASSFNFLKVAT